MTTICKLSPVLEEKAKCDLNEDPSRIEDDIKYIKEWISKQPHLKIPDDDRWILAFLRGCKYRLEHTKSKLDNYYTFRTIYPEVFRKRDITSNPLRDLINLGVILPYKSKINETQPVYLFTRFNFDIEKYNFDDLQRLYHIIYDVCILEYDETTINGIIGINDLANTSVTKMAAFTPTLAKRTMDIAIKGYPLRFKGTHFINVPQGFKSVLELIKLFVSDKIKERYFVHTKLTDLLDHIPVNDLPKDLGGENITLDELTEFWKSKLQEYKDFLINDEQYCSDENLRIEKACCHFDMYGVDGSFRKLSID